jgi:hypothetical protein
MLIHLFFFLLRLQFRELFGDERTSTVRTKALTVTTGVPIGRETTRRFHREVQAPSISHTTGGIGDRWSGKRTADIDSILAAAGTQEKVGRKLAARVQNRQGFRADTCCTMQIRRPSGTIRDQDAEVLRIPYIGDDIQNLPPQTSPAIRRDLAYGRIGRHTLSPDNRSGDGDKCLILHQAGKFSR